MAVRGKTTKSEDETEIGDSDRRALKWVGACYMQRVVLLALRPALRAASTRTMGIEDSMRSKLTAALNPVELNIINDSAKARRPFVSCVS
jgi:hypothetical protein